MQIHIRKILSTEFAWANDQYDLINFSPSSESDFIAVAEIDGVKAGLGRLIQIKNNTGELGGIYVLPEFRGHSIATRIIEFLLKNSRYPTLFCIPFASLEMFYQRFGFLSIDSTVSVPKTMAKKMTWCENRYEAPVILMCQHQ